MCPASHPTPHTHTHHPPGRVQVKWEPAAPVGDKSSQDLLQQESLFPHLYGTIDFESVAGELPMQRGGDGSFLAIPGLL